MYEREYEKFLRHLFKRPEYRKPAIRDQHHGYLWLFKDEPADFRTTNINKQIRDAINRYPLEVYELTKNLFYCYFDALEMF